MLVSVNYHEVLSVLCHGFNSGRQNAVKTQVICLKAGMNDNSNNVSVVPAIEMFCMWGSSSLGYALRDATVSE